MITYFTSVLIWMCIAFGLTVTLKDQIIANGWIDSDMIYESMRRNKAQKLINFVAICMVPIFRLLVCVAIFAMSVTKKEDWL